MNNPAETICKIAVLLVLSAVIGPGASSIAGGQDPRQLVEDRSSSEAAKARGEINFDDLKFPIEKDQRFEDSMLTEDVKELSGRTFKLRGYILPTNLFTEKNIRQFVLVRDNQECCFGPGASLYDCVIVDMAEGETTDFVTRPITVKGELTIDTKSYAYPGGKGPRGTSHMAIYHITAETVK